MAAICLCLACCELHLKTEMTSKDLEGFHHMSDLIANTLNVKKARVLGEFPMRAHIAWEYKSFEASRKQVELAHSYIKSKIGFDLDTVKEELKAITS